MIQKIIKKIVLVFILLSIVAGGLSFAGKLPQSVYSRILGFVVEIKGGVGYFDGTWIARADASIQETDEAFCGTAEGKFIVRGTHMYGSVKNEFGNVFIVTASVGKGGDISGGMALGTENKASFTGILLDSNGSGSWEDILGCFGDILFSRITALSSSDARYIQEISGKAFVVRGMRTLPAKPGFILKPGDVLAVEEASLVKIMLGDSLLRITEKTKFEIPDDTVEAENPSFIDRGWTALKYLIQGPSFEIKTPTATAGVRG